jgi:transposase-like protein
MGASIIRTIFAQPDKEHVLIQVDESTRMLTRSHPKVALMLEDARGDVLAFTGFPHRHWRQIWSTYPLELVNKEIKRRTDDGKRGVNIMEVHQPRLLIRPPE